MQLLTFEKMHIYICIHIYIHMHISVYIDIYLYIWIHPTLKVHTEGYLPPISSTLITPSTLNSGCESVQKAIIELSEPTQQNPPSLHAHVRSCEIFEHVS